MIKVIGESTHTARKRQWCDSCCRQIRLGERYHRQAQSDGGEIAVYRDHVHCREASEIVAAEFYWPDIEDGMPRVCDMEDEDREHVAAVAPDAYVMIWGDG